jgi:hypothetical protein
MTVKSQGGLQIGGTLRYENVFQTVLPGVKVYLKTGCCTIVDSTITNAAGYFSFQGLAPGYYTLMPVKADGWGGVNSDDALLALKDFVNLLTLENLPKYAADPDGNHMINSTDALMIAKRFVGHTSQFPVPDWKFENPTLTVVGSNQSVTVKGICIGDANTSYIP